MGAHALKNNNVIPLLYQAGRNRNMKQGFSEVDTAQLFRLLGQIEAATKQNTESVGMIVKTLEQNNMMTGQIRSNLETFKIGMDITEIIAKEARQKAQEAYNHADGAHTRLNKLVWMALGGGSVAGFIFGLFSDTVVAFVNAITHSPPGAP